MEKKYYLDLEGLKKYNSALRDAIDTDMGSVLQEALSQFKGALIPRGIIKNEGADHIDLRSEHLQYKKAQLGDTYFVGDTLFITYVDTAGSLQEDIEVEQGDSLICLSSASISESGEVLIDAKWDIIQANWNLKTYPSVRMDIKESQNTVIVAEIEGQTIQFQVPAASEIVSSLKTSLENIGIVKFASNPQEENKRIATSVSIDSEGNKVPTDKAVYDFVSKFTPNAVTSIELLPFDDDNTSITLDIKGGDAEGWLTIPTATNLHDGVMTAEDKKKLDGMPSITPITTEQINSLF